MKPYVPEILPVSDLDHTELISIVGEANSSLSRYDGLLYSMINPEIMLSPLLSQEAVLSSKIEGTQATFQEVLEHESGQKFDQAKNEDIKEIINYRQALMAAQEHIKSRPLNNSLLLSLHKILLDSVRGADKSPGLFRKTQNWIGSKGCTIEEAKFVPPIPLKLDDHLRAFQEYLAYPDIEPLIQTSIIHAQFELIHPFLDGNGRIGRLLVPLFLFYKKKISAPMFYVSEYLENNRDEYYERLLLVSKEQDWTGWVGFFLKAIDSQAKTNTKKLKQIVDLYEITKREVMEATHSQYGLPIVDFLFTKPIFSSTEFCKYSSLNRVTGSSLIRKLNETKIIHILAPSAGSKPAIYIFSELINITEGKTK